MSDTDSATNDEVFANEITKTRTNEAPITDDEQKLNGWPRRRTSSGSPPTVVLEQTMSPSKEDTAEASPNGKNKHATMDIYRPPSLRSVDGNTTKTRLNVHAKEFVMGNEKKTKNDVDNKGPTSGDKFSSLRMDAKPFKPYPLNTSKSSISAFCNLLSSNLSTKSNENQKDSCDLQRVKSSSNVGLSLDNHGSSTNAKSNKTQKDMYNLLRVKSSCSVPWENGASTSRVQFKPTINGEKGDFDYSEKTKLSKKTILESSSGNLKRSKSLNAKDALKFVQLETPLTKSFTQYDLFPEKLHHVIRQAVEHTDQLEDKSKIALGRKVVELAVDDKELASVAAKLSVIIIDKDKAGAYYDSLLNTCQMLYQTKKISSSSHPTKLFAFLAFVQEFYTELKRRKLPLKMSESIGQRESIFLMLIAKCCVDIVANNATHSVAEIECLFLTLTKVGRDIENEVPKMFKKVFDTIREVLLAGQSAPEIRKVLLQLLELRACEWQLPLSALNFYYPKVLI